MANAIELPDIISNDMVLQQEKQEAKLWGWASPGNHVLVTTGWNQETYQTRASATGRWEVGVKTPAAGFEKYTIGFREYSSLPHQGSKPVDEKQVKGVLIGEVWFCSGQSNMEMPLGGFWNCPVEGANEAILKSSQYRHAVRVATIEHQLEHCGCVCTSDLMYEHEIDQIHGCKKKEIGERLAWLALTRDYGMEGLAAEAPEFEYMEWADASESDKAIIAGSAVTGHPAATGSILRIYFSNSEDGFDRMSSIQGFEAQDADGTWHPATVWASSAWQHVKRQGCFLALICPEATTIKNIRYCYHNFVIGQLHNLRGLPVVPFTTEKPL